MISLLLLGRQSARIAAIASSSRFHYAFESFHVFYEVRNRGVLQNRPDMMRLMTGCIWNENIE